jgi:hypothetical protein
MQLKASLFTFIKIWWHAATLLIYFYIYRAVIHNLYIILVEIHSCYPHCIRSVEGLLQGCRAGIRTRACRTASRCATIWATPHPKEPHRTLSLGQLLLYIFLIQEFAIYKLNCINFFVSINCTSLTVDLLFFADGLVWRKHPWLISRSWPISGSIWPHRY